MANNIPSVRKFRKKPVVIEAVQMKLGNIKEARAFCPKMILVQGVFYSGLLADKYFIETLEGKMEVSQNDWIIKGVSGEFYPCKPEIFEKTYEEVIL